MNTFIMDSPLGKLVIATAADNRLSGIDFADPAAEASPPGLLAKNPAVRQLQEYFAGRRLVFDIAYGFAGTSFQQQVWQQIARIPFGETRTYGELAAAIGKPTASRAVGAACGKNPIAIIVPCHRVVGVGSKLTGYAGGLERKAWLLDFECQQRGQK